MKRKLQLLRALYVEESGQDLMEYALVAALIALVAVASLGTLGQNINQYIFQKIVTPLSGI